MVREGCDITLLEVEYKLAFSEIDPVKVLACAQSTESLMARDRSREPASQLHIRGLDVRTVQI
jgi:hypothetical protein